MHTKLRYLLLVLLIMSATGLFAQAWAEVSLVNSIPINDQFSPDFSFRDLTDPGLGIGLGLSYTVKRLTVGLDTRYVSYRSNIEGLEVKSFRIGPRVDYIFFNDGWFYPYLGASFSMHQIRAFIGPDLSSLERQSNTYVGPGVRAGVFIRVAERVAIRVGAEYSHINDFPMIDTNLGVAVDLGDF